MEPSADARIAVLRVAGAGRSTNIAYLKDAQWVERPRASCSTCGRDPACAGRPLVVEGDVDSWQQRLSGRLLAMGYDVPSHSVVVRFDAVKETPGGHMETRRFESVIPHVGDHAKAITPAINHAANDVARQIVAWLG
jgi:cholesterol transport system auxiliary component